MASVISGGLTAEDRDQLRNRTLIGTILLPFTEILIQAIEALLNRFNLFPRQLFVMSVFIVITVTANSN